MTEPANPTTAPTTAKPRKAATARRTADKALATTRRAAGDLASRTADTIEANPVAALIGGAALGALAGAFVPRTDREAQLLAPVGKRITDTARGAVDAARDTARNELDLLGLTRDAARGQMSKVLEGVVGALASAGAAALAGQAVAKAAADEPARPTAGDAAAE